MTTLLDAVVVKALGKGRNAFNYKRCKLLLESHLVTEQVESREATCNFCDNPLERPFEPDVIRFCCQSCAGKALVRNKVLAG